MSALHGAPDLGPIEWDTGPDDERKKFALEFDAHGPFVWIGLATDSADAISQARADLSRKNPTFDTSHARLVSVQEMHR